MLCNARRRNIQVACRILSFLISVFVVAHNFYSQSALIDVSNNTSTSITATYKNRNANVSSFSNIDEYMELTTPKADWTLVHYDPFLMGGFRNQHMRFVAFVNKAAEHNITQILLPSLRWGDATNPGKSAPHELLFDVVYWNKRAEEFGLPRLVRYEADILEQNIGGGGKEIIIPCFNTTSSMYSGLDEKKWRSKDINLRKHRIWDYLGEPSLYAHCKQSFGVIHSPNNTFAGPMTYLMPHGGTILSGRLWWEYDAMQGHRLKADAISGKYPDHLPLEKAIYKLLIPSLPIRNAIQKSLDDAIGTSTIKPTVLALHPRIEYEMMSHMCSRFMQSNLTKIFELIGTLPRFDLLFLAVSRAQVDGEPPVEIQDNNNLLRVATENRILLNQMRTYGVWGTEEHKGIPVLESGISTAAKIEFPVMGQSNHDGSEFETAESLGVTELVASLVNFFTALKADTFVGVRGSTYSQDVFSVRYYQHQDSGGGENNFVVGPFGMRQHLGPAEPLPCK